MGIDKKLVKLWKEKREDVATTLKVLREFDIVKEEDVAFLTEKLDIVASASNEQSGMISVVDPAGAFAASPPAA